MASRGRRPIPLKDPRTQALIVALKGGNYLEHACAFAGLAPSTVYRWLERGRAEQDRRANGMAPNRTEGHFLELCEAIEKARGEAVVANVTIVQKAAREGTWQAAAWWLERTMPDRFGRQIKAEVKVNDDDSDLNAEVARLWAILDQVESNQQITMGEESSST